MIFDSSNEEEMDENATDVSSDRPFCVLYLCGNTVNLPPFTKNCKNKNSITMVEEMNGGATG
jgi:hypothetical protein